MTQEEVIKLAKEAGFGNYAYEAAGIFERFAALVAAAEREKCTGTQEFVTLPREALEQALNALDAGVKISPNSVLHDRLRAALEHPQNHVPDAGNMVTAGWRLVPVEPTEKMVDMGRGLSSFPNGVYRAMLSAAPQPPTVKDSLTVEQPQANQPAMTPIAQRKLDSLLNEGYAISGYSVYHERKHQHGFVTGAGLVGWWKPDGVEYPQPLGEQEPRCLAGGSRYKVTHLKTSGYCIIGLPEDLLGRWVALVDATDNKHMDSHQQPPTTDKSSVVQPQGEQKPRAWLHIDRLGGEQAFTNEPPPSLKAKCQPLYTHSQNLNCKSNQARLATLWGYEKKQPPRQPLTDDEIADAVRGFYSSDEAAKLGFPDDACTARAIERAHNIK